LREIEKESMKKCFQGLALEFEEWKSLSRRILKSGIEEKDEERWRGEYEKCRGEEY
jgi:extradiol dioxygenase family protein